MVCGQLRPHPDPHLSSGKPAKGDLSTLELRDKWSLHLATPACSKSSRELASLASVILGKGQA